MTPSQTARAAALVGKALNTTGTKPCTNQSKYHTLETYPVKVLDPGYRVPRPILLRIIHLPPGLLVCVHDAVIPGRLEVVHENPVLHIIKCYRNEHFDYCFSLTKRSEPIHVRGDTSCEKVGRRCGHLPTRPIPALEQSIENLEACRQCYLDDIRTHLRTWQQNMTDR